MKITSITAALGTALFLAGSPLLASAAEVQSAPIQINDVAIDQSYGIRNDFNPGLASVKFTNQNASPATEIVFALEGQDGKVIDQFQDVGNYAKGVAVRHNFQDIQIDSHQNIAVKSAKFADGTTWENPNISYRNYPDVVGF